MDEQPVKPPAEALRPATFRIHASASRRLLGMPCIFVVLLSGLCAALAAATARTPGGIGYAMVDPVLLVRAGDGWRGAGAQDASNPASIFRADAYEAHTTETLGGFWRKIGLASPVERIDVELASPYTAWPPNHNLDIYNLLTPAELEQARAVIATLLDQRSSTPGRGARILAKRQRLYIPHFPGIRHDLIRLVQYGCGLLAIAGLWRLFVPTRQEAELRGSRASSCPFCGYSRSGLTSPYCPECGTTLPNLDHGGLARSQSESIP